MAYWVFQYPFCKTEFIYSEISKNLELSELCFPRKPDFPMEGLALECPSCKKSSALQRHQLVYRTT
jgi:hypothetical protein